jgi:DNA-binding IscR family transcriptional regulator
LTLLEVVEAVIGEIFLNDCVMRPESCDRSHACAIHCIWSKAKDQLRQTLKEATFDRILKETRCKPSLTVELTSTGRSRRGINRLKKGAK